MTISTKGRYALRIMMDLAGHMGETVKLKDIAARQDISEKYMEQIVAVLNKAGYVRSTRGATGWLSAGETAAAVHGWYDTETDRRLSGTGGLFIR